MANNDTPQIFNCGMCKYFCPNLQDVNRGECRSKPPQAFAIANRQGGVDVMGGFPGVTRIHWCGDFKAKMIH